jgi:hypothetical protein
MSNDANHRTAYFSAPVTCRCCRCSLGYSTVLVIQPKRPAAALDNGFAACCDVPSVQQICDRTPVAGQIFLKQVLAQPPRHRPPCDWS